MATYRQKYVSIFKIDGVPILPPLMTAEKCREMRKFKEMAMQIELRKSKHQNKDKPSTPMEYQCNLLRHGHSHIPQPQTPRRHAEIGSTIPESIRERVEKLRQTDTLVYDNRANSIILTLEGFEDETDFQSVEIAKPQTLDQNENIRSSELPKSPSNKDDIPQRPQPYAAFIPIPSICVNPPTPSIASNPICETPPSRRLCSPSLKAEPESNLIRSNSFTLDGPSSALLEHIKNQKLKKSTATQDTVESKAKRVQKVDVKSKTTRSPSSPNLCHFTTNTSLFKAKRSPYDVKQSSKTKLRGKHKLAKPNIPKKNAHKADHSTRSLPSTPKSLTKLDMLKDIEEQHRTRFMELVRQQQSEQKRLQEQFETQQKLLLQQLSARMAKVQLESPSPTVDSPLSSHSPSPEQDSITTTRLTPRRRLFVDKSLPAGTSQPQDASSPRNSIRRQEIKIRRQWAATKICAHARGYLARRLFRTDYVQRIVQTIKDTLIFVLNLHLDTCNDTSEASVKLKARLLQQLTSATRTLHVIFFEGTTKERMEIISRDRKYIQTKLLNMKRGSPRIIR